MQKHLTFPATQYGFCYVSSLFFISIPTVFFHAYFYFFFLLPFPCNTTVSLWHKDNIFLNLLTVSAQIFY